MKNSIVRLRSRRAGVALVGGAVVLTAVPAAAFAFDDSGSSTPAHHVSSRDAAAAPGRGTVVSATRVAHMTGKQTGAYLKDNDDALASPRPRNGVDAYRVVYRTITPTGRPTTASGIVALPSTAPRKALRAVSFAHGTLANKKDAGGTAEDGQGRVAAVYYAAAGYAGVAPDYLGLGLGPGPHPYMHSASEASASLDMLRAARTVAASHGVRFQPRVTVTGFSQGGVAAMALGRELGRGADPHLRLGPIATISGPFDLLRAQLPESLSPRSTLAPKASVFYLAYITTAWKHGFGLYRSPSEVFNAPYASIVEGLFDGSKNEVTEILPKLPDTPEQLLTPAYRKRLAHPSGTLLKAIRSSDGTCDWRPDVPVRLFAGSGDEQVAYANTLSCARALRAHGARPQVVDYGPKSQHMGSLKRGLPDILRWLGRSGR
ncbi:lipase family protein [Actinomadura terrae]|uniref:lipase family protein n=1 Tax=Actinomadura terrae TaxID=604353 RepID=UPI001FA78DC6|nr:lipase family protein [Actinomadura terrae]